jgi:hypothetical protein
MTPVRINKRKRGGQPGNSNARKHGFYSPSLSIDETKDFWQAVYLEGSDPALAILRIKLASALRRNPSNRRVLREASCLLTKWYRARYRLNRRDEAVFKKFVRRILERILEIACDKTNDFAGTNRACGDKQLLKLPERIEAETIR